MTVTFAHATLDHGLNIVGETDPYAHTASIGFFIKTGARDEEASVMGVSHFLEHMMFKGSLKRSADDVNREFDEIGASYNAYTSSEMTCFYATVLPEFLPRAQDLLADMLRPALRTEDFDSEKGVILEEIAMYKDNPFWVLYEAAAERRYPDHGLGRRVLGTNETVTALERDQMQAYFDDRYSADNTVVALAGAMDFASEVDRLSSLCSSWARTGAGRDSLDAPAGGADFTLRDENVHRAYALHMSPAPSAQDNDRHAAMLLAQILGDHSNSRLHWALIEPGLADEAQASFEPHDHTGDFVVFASCEPDRIDDVWSIVEREIAALPDAMREDDLVRLRSRLATAVTVAGERPGGRMQRIGRQWTYLDRVIPLEEELALIKAVTLDDVRACFEKYAFAPGTVGRLVPANAADSSVPG